MPYTLELFSKQQRIPTFHELFIPVQNIFHSVPPLEAKGNRPLQMNFEQQLKALIYYHLEEHSSGKDLLLKLQEDDFDRTEIAPPDGIKKSSFFKAINHRCIEQLLVIFTKLQANATKALPKEYEHLGGELVSIDGSLINAVHSLHWADYRKGAKKAMAHLGFHVNHSIPSKIYLANGKGDERPFVSKILSPRSDGNHGPLLSVP